MSLLWAVGDDQLAGRIRDAHGRAVDQALGYLERTACVARRGKAGAVRIETDGFVAAVRRHRTSRTGDPNLHSHCIIANRVLGADGRWSAPDGRLLYAQVRTAGTLYQAALRHELADLGLTWTVARTGLAEMDGVPHSVLRAFSTRRREIEAHMTAQMCRRDDGLLGTCTFKDPCKPRAVARPTAGGAVLSWANGGHQRRRCR